MRINPINNQTFGDRYFYTFKSEDRLWDKHKSLSDECNSVVRCPDGSINLKGLVLISTRGVLKLTGQDIGDFVGQLNKDYSNMEHLIDQFINSPTTKCIKDEN